MRKIRPHPNKVDKKEADVYRCDKCGCIALVWRDYKDEIKCKCEETVDKRDK